MATVTIPFADPELFHRPHPVLHHVRAHDPVHWSEEMEAWVLLRYSNVRHALSDPRLSSTGMARRIERHSAEDQLTLAELRRTVERWMGLPTLEDHKRYSTLLRPRFSASSVRSMEPEISRCASNLLDEFIRQGGGDMLEDFATPYAIDVISQLCGLPRSRQMASTLADWARTLSNVFHVSEIDGLLAAQRAAQQMTAYLQELIAARRRAPRDDLVSLFLTGRDSGLIHDDEEIVANLIMIIAVGFETTSHVIATGTHLLLEHERQLERLREDPSACASAVEEIARFDGPVFFTTRVARADLELGSRQVKAGDLVLLCLAAANRDPVVFSQPDEFLVTRAKNPHLGFGAGHYSCLGARLARTECRIAFEQIVTSMPTMRLAAQPDWYEFPPLSRWIARLPVRCSTKGSSE